MRNLTRAELGGIEERARLWADYGDRTALRVEDVVDLITTARELMDQRDHLIALNRQARDRLAEEVAQTSGRAVPYDVLEADPP